MSRSNERLLSNALNADFQQMLRPYYWTQRLLCASKYSIKDNFVLPNSRAYCAVSVLVLCFITYVYVVTSVTTTCTIKNGCPLMTYVHYLFAHFVATVCIIVQTEPAVKLLIRMQGIDRKLVSFNVTNLPYFVVQNWCCIMFIAMIFGIDILVVALNTDHFSWPTYVVIFLTMVFDLDLLLATCVVEFLSSRLNFFSNFFITCIDSYNNRLNTSVETNSAIVFKDLFEIPKEVLKAFTLSSGLVQYSILSYILKTFINSLVSMQTVIEWAKDVKISEMYINISIMYVLAIVWNIKNFVLIIVFSLGCERFNSRLDDIRKKCTIAYDSSPGRSVSRKTAKNILRLCNVRFTKMRVCGLFAVDAALPLRLVGLVATYCIVLLQFAFL